LHHAPTTPWWRGGAAAAWALATAYSTSVYANAAGQLDDATLHAGLPVIEGEEWVLTKWMRARPFIAA